MNRYFDSTLLKPESNVSEIEKLCREALQYEFAAVCVPPCYVKLANNILKGSNVNMATVIGFPLGNTTTDSKVFETKNAIKNGANEIDMVMNIGLFKSGNYDSVKSDIKSVVDAAHESNAIVKVILETCLLSDEEIIKACNISIEAGAEFVKTSTGFNFSGAEVRIVKLMKDTIGDRGKVKAAGGIRDLDTAKAMIQAGADRLGCSCAKKIMEAL